MACSQKQKPQGQRHKNCHFFLKIKLCELSEKVTIIETPQSNPHSTQFGYAQLRPASLFEYFID